MGYTLKTMITTTASSGVTTWWSRGQYRGVPVSLSSIDFTGCDHEDSIAPMHHTDVKGRHYSDGWTTPHRGVPCASLNLRPRGSTVSSERQISLTQTAGASNFSRS